MQEHLIIIGGVAAGAKAASKARKENPDLKISIYTEGRHISYSACALPYYIEDLITDQSKLLIRSPEIFKTKYNIDVFTEYRVIEILPDSKEIQVEDIKTGNKFKVKYSALLISTGARAFMPNMEGMNLNNVFILRSFADGIAIKNSSAKARKTVIAGTGYIGLEMAESFYNSGHDVTMIEQSNQILPVLDIEMAEQIQKYLEEEKQLKIILNNKIKRLIGNENNTVKQIETNDAKIIDADLVLFSIGIRPNVELAQSAGIELGETGAIKVNEKMQTNIPDIYAAGDCVEDIDMITGKPVWMPLGSSANKQGRIAAINITGGKARFKGVLRSYVSKVFDYTVAKTGLTEKEAQKYNYNYEIIIVTHKDKSSYYPDAREITIKLIADKHTRKLLGAQIIGKGDADKRINIIATALTAGMTVDDIQDIDITYAPPYSPAIDPVIIAAQNLQEKL